MNSVTKTILSSLLILFATINHIHAQSNDHKEKRWFWDWFFEGVVLEIRPSEIYDDLDRRIDLNGDWLFSIQDNPEWAKLSYDDQKWERIKAPSSWENEGFNGYNGYAWYRIHFDGRLLNQDDTNLLILGFIDDVDETYINGDLIGRSGRFPPKVETAYNANRKYYIPSESVNFEGDNVIAVRVYDDYIDGGIVSGKLGIYSTPKDKKLIQPLYGQWKFNNTDNRKNSRLDLDDQDWDNLTVPSLWDNQGYRSHEGVGWYRKKFILDFKPDPEKTYYLILGKIDDFDTTYLNGTKIGSTNDGLKYGQSTSYSQVRSYEIPKGLLLQNSGNLIAVRVIDIGNYGGIYEGTIGIVEESNLTRMIREN
ncbi:MAG: hypothetical protein ACJA2S_004036 [Cyclobacteriaceae bacterium]|jgi:sialate O-acetylesterase